MGSWSQRSGSLCNRKICRLNTHYSYRNEMKTREYRLISGGFHILGYSCGQSLLTLIFPRCNVSGCFIGRVLLRSFIRSSLKQISYNLVDGCEKNRLTQTMSYFDFIIPLVMLGDRHFLANESQISALHNLLKYKTKIHLIFHAKLANISNRFK